MYPIDVISNSNLTSKFLDGKTVKVYLKYKSGEWKDITQYVTNIEISEALQYNNFSAANKLGLSLLNTNGEFSPAKVGAPFNEAVVSGGSRTFLNTKFPIKVEVTANSTTYTIFRGYANRVTDSGLKASIEAYDLLYLLSRKRYTKQLNVVNDTAINAIHSLITDGGFQTKWNNDFGAAVALQDYPSTSNNKIMLVDTAKTYLEAINKILQSVGGILNYRPIDNKLYIIVPSDSNFTVPSAAITLTTSEVNSFDITQEQDVTNRVVIKSSTYEPQDLQNDNYWKYEPETLDSAVLLPANSRGNVNIDFGVMGYSPTLSTVHIKFCTYNKTTVNGQVVYQKGGTYIERISLNLTSLPVIISQSGVDYIKIHSVSVSASGVEMEIENLDDSLNFAIEYLRIPVKPIISTGELTQIFEVSDIPTDEPRTEQQLTSAYFTITDSNNPLQKQAEMYLKLQAPQYNAELELLGFYPHLNVGGVVKVTLHDTSFNETVCVIKSATHKINKFTTTEIKVSPLVSLSTILANSIPSYAVVGTPSPLDYSVPTPAAGQEASVTFDKQKLKITLPLTTDQKHTKYIIDVNGSKYETTTPYYEVTLPPATTVTCSYCIVNTATNVATNWIALLTEATVVAIDNAQIASLSAGKITSGTIGANQIFIGGDNVEIDGAASQIRIRDDYGDEAISIGRIATPTSTQATFTRSTIAYKEGGEQVAVNEPRYKAGSVLIEESTTNMLTDVLDLTAASWGKTEVTVISSNGSAPDGSNTTLFNVVPSTNSAVHELLTSPISITNGTKYAFSFIAKANGYNYLKVRLPDAQFGTNTWIVVNLTNGAIESTSGNPLRKLVKSLGNGFYHIQIADTAVAAGTGIQFSIGVYNDAACATFAGDGTKGVYIWRPQVEAKAYATTFVNGARNADILGLPITNDIVHPEHGSAAVRFYVPEGGLVGPEVSKILLYIGRTSAVEPRIALYYDIPGNNLRLRISNNSGIAYVAGNVQLSTGWHTMVAAWNKTEQKGKIFLDGAKLAEGAVAAASFVSSWAEPYTSVGNRGDGSAGDNTYHDFVAFWNRPLTDAEATSITTTPLSVPDYTAFYDFNNNLKNEQLSYGIKITNGYIDAGAIKSGTIDANNITVTNLHADSITVGKINGTQISDSAIASNHIVDGAVNSGKIANLAITVDKIANSAITVDKVANLAITVDKIATAAITVDKVAANAITSDKLVNLAVTSNKIADTAITSAKMLHSAANGLNLIINSNFVDANGNPTLDGWAALGAATVVDVGANGGITSRYALQNIGANAWYYSTNKIPIDRSKKYVAECYARTISGDTGTFFLVVKLLDANGNNIAGDGTWWYYPALSVVPPSTWQFYYGFFGYGTAKPFPDNAAYMQIGVILNYQSGTNRIMQAQGLRIREVIDDLYVGDLSANKITTGTLNTETLIATGSIDGNKIKANSITAAQIAANAITSDEILAGAITADKISANAITSDKIAANAITSDKISANAITAAQIAANAITSDKIAANAITSDKILANAVTSDKVAANTITSDKIAANAITSDKIMANAITGDKIAANSITAVQIATNAVTSDKIMANAITGDKIAANSITAAQIATNAITSDEIAAGAITSDKISAGAITSDKIEAGAITATQIAANTITGDKIAAETITGDKIAADTISANKLRIGTTKTSSLLVRGTSESNATPIQPAMVRVDDTEFTNSTQGLMLVTINRATHAATKDAHIYDVFTSDDECTALANTLNALDNTVIVVLASYGKIKSNTELEGAIANCGGSLPASYVINNPTLPYVLIGIPKIGRGKGIERYTTATTNSDQAIINTILIDGTPSTMQNTFTDMTIIDGGQIKTNSITADKIQAETTFTQKLYVGNNSITLDGPSKAITLSNGVKTLTLRPNGGTDDGPQINSTGDLTIVGGNVTIESGGGVINLGNVSTKSLTLKDISGNATLTTDDGSINFDAESHAVNVSTGTGSDVSTDVAISKQVDYICNVETGQVTPTPNTNGGVRIVGKNSAIKLGIINKKIDANTRTPLLYYFHDSAVDRDASSSDVEKTIDGRTIFKQSIYPESILSKSKEVGSGTYASVTPTALSLANYNFNGVYISLMSTSEVQTNCMNDYVPQTYYTYTEFQNYGDAHIGISSSACTLSSGTVTGTITFPSTYSRNKYTTWYGASSNIDYPACGTRGWLDSQTSTPVIRETPTDITIYGTAYITISATFSSYPNRRVRMKATIGGTTYTVYAITNSSGVATFSISFDASKFGTSGLTRSLSFTPTFEYNQIINYIHPVTVPGTVVFSTSTSAPIVDGSGFISTNYLNLIDGAIYVGALPTYISKIDYTGWGSSTPNYGALYIYDLEAIRGKAESGDVFVRFFDDRYAIYMYEVYTKLWYRMSGATSYNSNAFITQHFGEAIKVAIGFTSTTGGSGLEFAIRINE